MLFGIHSELYERVHMHLEVDMHPSRSFRSVILVLLTIGCFSCAPTFALASISSELIKGWEKSLDDAEKDLANPDLNDARLLVLRDKVITLESDVKAVRLTVNDELTELNRDLDALGAPPEAGSPHEAPNLRSRRKQLNDQLSVADGLAKEADLTLSRAERVSENIKRQRRARFTDHIFTRSLTPFNESVWKKAAQEGFDVYNQFRTDLAPILNGVLDQKAMTFQGVGLLAGGLLFLFAPFAPRALVALRQPKKDPAPNYLQKLQKSISSGLIRGALPTLAILVFYESLVSGDSLSGQDIELLWGLSLSLIAYFLLTGICLAALSPNDSVWRIVHVSDVRARSICWAFRTLGLLFLLDHQVLTLLDIDEMSVETVAFHKSLFCGLVSFGLLLLLRKTFWVDDHARELGILGRDFKTLLLVLVLAIPLGVAFGYVSLAYFVTIHLVLSVALIGLVLLARQIAVETVSALFTKDSRFVGFILRHLAINDDDLDILCFWITGILSFVIYVIGLLTFFLLWSFDQKESMNGLANVFFGFKVGEVFLSPAKILSGFLIFATLLTITRFIQKALVTKVFPKARLDNGLRHSITSAVGYVGFALSVMTGISGMGVDLSNLAILAGALTVGIGFGLQNIVNNFVSGLILLVERPIKAGDMVAVGDHQGLVKKISVRATEIRTADRASVFIPNSNLISGVVLNRTHNNKIGRITIPVVIAFDSDARAARQILVGIAAQMQDIQKTPEPSVFLTSCSDGSTDLELVVFVENIERLSQVKNDLWLGIIDAFNSGGLKPPRRWLDPKLL